MGRRKDGRPRSLPGDLIPGKVIRISYNMNKDDECTTKAPQESQSKTDASHTGETSTSPTQNQNRYFNGGVS